MLHSTAMITTNQLMTKNKLGIVADSTFNLRQLCKCITAVNLNSTLKFPEIKVVNIYYSFS